MSGTASAAVAAMGIVVILVTVFLILYLVAGLLVWGIVTGGGLLYAMSRLIVFVYCLSRGEPFVRAARLAAAQGSAAVGYVLVVTGVYFLSVGFLGQLLVVVVRAQVGLAERAGETSRFADVLGRTQDPGQAAITVTLILVLMVVGVALLLAADKLDPRAPADSALLGVIPGGRS